MCPRDQSQAVIVIERFRNILSERVARTTRRDTPATSVIRITPEQITHGPFVRDFLDPVESANVVEGVNRRTETAVEAEDLILNQGSKGEVIKEVREILPDISVAIFPQTLVVEAIDLCDLTGLVVSTQDRDALRVADFESNKESDGLDGVVPTVNVVP